MQKRNKRWLESNGSKRFKEIQVGDSVRVSNLVFKENRKKKSHMVIKSYKPNWSREIYRVVSISHLNGNNNEDNEDAVKQLLYTLCTQDTVHLPPTQQNRLQLFRDSIQLLLGPNPRVTTSPRPTYQGFFYHEEQRQRARNARGRHNNQVVEPLAITDEARQRRRPNTRLGENYYW